LLIIAFFFLRPKGEGFVARTMRAFQTGTRRLFLSPNLGLSGLTFAIVAQLTTSAVFALNLAAVSHGGVPWSDTFWVFPAITVLSCMPFTIAGIGTRELAAIGLLGMYGVPTADAAAASLLTLLDISLWAGIGALVFWREELRLGKLAPSGPVQTISAIIPALNEAERLPETITRLRQVPEISEIIVVDGGSTDRTVAIVRDLECCALFSPAGRGQQLRLGAEQAKGDVVLLLHADSWLPPWAGRAILDCLRDPFVVAGGFWKRFHNSPKLLLGSRFRCAIRLLLGRRIAGDQALFVRRTVLSQLGGVPDMPLMEEYELCRRLRQAGRLTLADATIVTSARRFREFGIFRTYFRMWWVSVLYRLGRPPHELAQIYNRGLRSKT
jgi:rSAM/selenodomain-associated transferase 2